MAQAPGIRAQALSGFFTRRYGFHAEKHIVGATIFKRDTGRGSIERMVVKHAPLGQGNVAPRDDGEIEVEERVLRSLWGSEHNVRLISITDDRDHKGARWDRPINRTETPWTLPWKLPVNDRRYPRVSGFRFFAMEYLARGTGEALLKRCVALGIAKISQPVLWYFFLCLTRACVGIAYPPSRKNRNPPEVWRETLPVPGQRRSRISHGDLHLGNVMFGDYDVGNANAQPGCHHVTPILKIIDFGMASKEDSSKEAHEHNMLNVGEKLMHELSQAGRFATVFEDYDSMPVYEIDDIDGRDPFDTWATEEFYESDDFTQDFKVIVAACMAARPEDRPTLQEVLDTCERNIALTPNWIDFKDEVSDLFDMPGN
ncbi:hypothetical protein E0Z10_g959 [Xylaria hypoxylon]|uniref:Protein kinase domain-containing protein n=1 Tax=Xylaria hypoxylon TaxID=37992 RepID=A0A4Z0ZA00_9PEZI|nr:hypothetical protein E0Z10_g959 [Xylaria hypoxylon]